ncbi:D-aminoacylase [Acidobacteria bacterium AB60]|nr:D-aminoacylase [Acidobacteria bacterium AB60]
MNCETVIRNARVLDGSGADAAVVDVALADGRITGIGPTLTVRAAEEVDGAGLVLAPGFIDTHTHDDTSVIETPQMLPKISQGVTTVIVGNCGISAAPVRLRGSVPDPMTLLGPAENFRYPTFAHYVNAVRTAQPAINVAALAGHTAIRNNHMDRLDRAATEEELRGMRADLQEALDAGAIGLSTGLAYANANAATTEEVEALAALLRGSEGVYATHMRTETERILDAMAEAFAVGAFAHAPVVISHLKCAGVDNWGRSEEVLQALEAARATQAVYADCYPYAAGSSTLDLKQVDERVEITITGCAAYPHVTGKSLQQIAQEWGVSQLEAARRLQPAGAIYHSIAESDMRRILAHPATMVGSDGLPHDSHPHPRLWGTFPRVLGRYCRQEKLFPLAQAVHKMTGMPAARFGLTGRGLIRTGYAADLVLFDADAVIDTATFAEPVRAAAGIERVWVNGILTYTAAGTTGARAGQFLARTGRPAHA